MIDATEARKGVAIELDGMQRTGARQQWRGDGAFARADFNDNVGLSRCNRAHNRFNDAGVS